MKWNSHIHIIITEGSKGNLNIFKNFDFVSYDALCKRFQKILLDLLEKKINNSNFKVLKSFVYKKSNKNFYVYDENFKTVHYYGIYYKKFRYRFVYVPNIKWNLRLHLKRY